jgi:predicted glutamine amidotransferase
MCELFGLSFNMAIKPSITYRGLCETADQNSDGWGLAFFPDEAVQVVKEPIEASKSMMSRFLQDYSEAMSKILIGHVRRSTVGTPTYKNTHPFQRELNGKNWVFVHKGTVKEHQALQLGRFRPIGDTDSEHVFCYILSLVEDEGIKGWDHHSFDWLAKHLKMINERGYCNFVFSDGERLFCYHDKDSFAGLHFTFQAPAAKRVKLLSGGRVIDMVFEADDPRKGFIVASVAMSAQSWFDFQPGELMVFKDGIMEYSNSRPVFQAEG